MSDAELLEGTTEALRAERRRHAHEERLELYVQRQLDAETLIGAARREGADDDLESELSAYTPLDAEARGRITALVLEQIADGGAPPASTTRGRVSPFRLTVAVSALALAASLAFVLRGKNPGPLPSYELSFVGGEQSWRGETQVDPATAHRFSRDAHIRLAARPSTAVLGPVEARMFLRRGEEVRVWPTSVDVSAAGAIRVVASRDTLPPGTEGGWDVIVAVGRPDALPGPGELDAEHAARGGFQLVTTHVELAP